MGLEKISRSLIGRDGVGQGVPGTRNSMMKSKRECSGNKS